MATRTRRAAPDPSSPPPAKRARLFDRDPQDVVQYRHSAKVVRPGLKPQIHLSDYRFESKPSPPVREDDKDGHYVYELGENLSSRYKILSKFGEGTFGRVLECWDRHLKDYVAVKIVRNVDKYRHAAMIELEVLNTLEENDPSCRRHCVKLKEWFDYRGHVCMVFEKLGPSLFDFLRRNEYQSFPMAVVQAFAKQLLEAVAYMHELNLVHTDLKPENILLLRGDYTKLAPLPGSSTRRVPRTAAIRVIDFGSATFEDQYHSTIVSTRHYRAPEVILGMGWSFPCDLWSVGCILVELATGEALFQTHENLEHLAMMTRALGPFPPEVVRRADAATAKFFNGGALRWPDPSTTRKSVKQVMRLVPIAQLLADLADPPSEEATAQLADLVAQVLRYDPQERISAAEALRHPFFSLQLPMPEPEAEVASGGGVPLGGGGGTSGEEAATQTAATAEVAAAPGDAAATDAAAHAAAALLDVARGGAAGAAAGGGEVDGGGAGSGGSEPATALLVEGEGSGSYLQEGDMEEATDAEVATAHEAFHGSNA